MLSTVHYRLRRPLIGPSHMQAQGYQGHPSTEHRQYKARSMHIDYVSVLCHAVLQGGAALAPCQIAQVPPITVAWRTRLVVGITRERASIGRDPCRSMVSRLVSLAISSSDPPSWNLESEDHHSWKCRQSIVDLSLVCSSFETNLLLSSTAPIGVFGTMAFVRSQRSLWNTIERVRISYLLSTLLSGTGQVVLV